MNKDVIYFAKMNRKAIIPSKRDEDAGYDIYACFDDEFKIIMPHETVSIPTGIASAFDDSYYAQLQERGSTGTKGIKYGAGVIDSGYRGEWWVPLTNTNNIPVAISKLNEKDTKYAIFMDSFIYYPYEKAIAQFVLLPVPKVTVKELTMYDLLMFKSERGNNCLGSSKK